jgi:hypothetical protein
LSNEPDSELELFENESQILYTPETDNEDMFASFMLEMYGANLTDFNIKDEDSENDETTEDLSLDDQIFYNFSLYTEEIESLENRFDDDTYSRNNISL